MEIYFSTDIESNGPIPGPFSMLSFASVAFMIRDQKVVVLGSFYANLELLPGSTPDPDTMDFWAKNQEAYDQTRTDLQSPNDAMKKYVDWVAKMVRDSFRPDAKPVFVGYPATFDFMFVYWYIRNAGLQSPFSFSALDIKTYVMAVLKSDFRDSAKRNMPKRWFPKLPHTHNALDDAMEQGHLFCNILLEYKYNVKSR